MTALELAKAMLESPDSSPCQKCGEYRHHDVSKKLAKMLLKAIEQRNTFFSAIVSKSGDYLDVPWETNNGIKELDEELDRIAKSEANADEGSKGDE